MPNAHTDTTYSLNYENQCARGGRDEHDAPHVRIAAQPRTFRACTWTLDYVAQVTKNNLKIPLGPSWNCSQFEAIELRCLGNAAMTATLQSVASAS